MSKKDHHPCSSLTPLIGPALMTKAEVVTFVMFTFSSGNPSARSPYHLRADLCSDGVQKEQQQQREKQQRPD